MNIAAILPCRGRHEQTVVNVKRLLATAGYDRWRLIAVGGKDDHVLIDSLASFGIEVIRSDTPRVTYWQALAGATQHTDAPYLVNLANDLLPGQHWLRRAVDSYEYAFQDRPAMVGFNGDSHELLHSCHFLISRELLDRYGGWPVWYDHNFGDAELCQRAITDKVYAKAPWALLYHNHVYFGADNDDAVYQEGRASSDRDATIFEQRRRQGWPSVPVVSSNRANGRISAVATAGSISV